MRLQTHLLLIAILAYLNIVNGAELFKSNKNNKYYVEPAAKYTWHDARRECESRKMDLLTIETEEKSQEVSEMLKKILTGKRLPRFYLGATDYIKHGEFSWITPSGRKKLTYTNWEKGEPNNYKNLGEHCMHLGFHGTDEWNDIRCHRKFGFICQERNDLQSLLNEVSRA